MKLLLSWWAIVYASGALFSAAVAVASWLLDRPDIAPVALLLLALTWTLALICLIFSKRAG